MEKVKKITNIKKWNKKTKINMCIFLLAVVLVIIFGCICPDEAKMTGQATEEMQELLKKDETSSRKRVTVTYNSLFIIKYCSYSSSGANAMSENYIGFAGKVYKADEGAALFTGQMVNYVYRMLGIGESALHGAKLTILLTTLSVLFGVILGTFLALGKISKRKLINKISSAYIFFFRGTPLLIQLFVVYFSVPSIFKFAWRNLFSSGDSQAVYKGAFLAALIAFALNSAAYCAEIIRAAIQSIDRGQYEASKALGLNYSKTMSLIIIPQSVKRMIPSICNEFIMVLKDASLVFAISLMDITTISKNIMTSEGSYLVFIPALIIYLIITAIFTFLFDKIEKKFSIYE